MILLKIYVQRGFAAAAEAEFGYCFGQPTEYKRSTDDQTDRTLHLN
jgi:hypothetical protein